MRRKNLFVSILLNCFWPDGSINWKRTWRETRYLARFVTTLLLVLLLFFGICATPIVLLYGHLVFPPTVMDNDGVFSINKELRKDDVIIDGDEVIKLEPWIKEPIFSKPIAPFWKNPLRDTWYIWAAFALYVIFSFYLLIVKLFINQFNRYKKKVFRREEVYVFKDKNYYTNDNRE